MRGDVEGLEARRVKTHDLKAWRIVVQFVNVAPKRASFEPWKSHRIAWNPFGAEVVNQHCRKRGLSDFVCTFKYNQFSSFHYLPAHPLQVAWSLGSSLTKLTRAAGRSYQRSAISTSATAGQKSFRASAKVATTIKQAMTNGHVLELTKTGKLLESEHLRFMDGFPSRGRWRWWAQARSCSACAAGAKGATHPAKEQARTGPDRVSRTQKGEGLGGHCVRTCPSKTSGFELVLSLREAVRP